MRLVRLSAILLLGFGCEPLYAAQLGASYDSYRDMHRDTAYGSLFFNATAIRHADNLAKKRFRAVTASGDIELPSQQGYCFVFNHYGRPTLDGKSHSYRAKITKLMIDGTNRLETVEQAFDPTDDLSSTSPPDLCIAGIRNVSKVTIEFTSDDNNYFDWQITFVPR
ncbi:hypothetical protein TSA1_22975 [Bradyrhizobium nitroreducens]|uniref:Uncharacterized protein n=1 Tax=Bradyrhizobium nitroreducens TaxID=709803 RepID=A0A2M6UFH1_9BRAD|nr:MULTISPECIES: hypothetical protein [Bradyrhizobium]PIT03305.1 hypothetical protein TSA1_22975 [Bradyrhizobium nitroreducens]TQF43440.1 hypothetical protein UNPF46_02265 [Bradyrhizobium sp. UNPF46]